MKQTITVEIENIKVLPRYYSFDYKVWIGGKLKDEGTYDSDYENGMSINEWSKELKNGYAVELVLQQVYS